MSFSFIAKGQNGDVHVLMSGVGDQPVDASAMPVFNGRFIAVAPPAGVAPSLLPVAIDEGDTGTGTGTQT